MCKKFMALILAFVMVVTLLPTAVFAASDDVTEPVTDEAASDGSPSSGDTQPPEEPIEEEEPDGSDMGIAPIAIEEADETFMRDYFKAFPGEYILPDGSGWKVIIDENGDLTMSSTDGKADNAYVDSITRSGANVTRVVFASNDWYNSKGNTAPQKLTLTWTTTVNSSYAHKSFKCAAATFYDAEGSLIKGFTTNCYFIASEGIFSYEYFKNGSDVSKGGSSYAYVGEYVLSDAYNTVYGGDIDGIGSWKIEVAADGHVYLHEGEQKYEAVMASGMATNGIQRVNEMYAAVPGWYTTNSCTAPVYVKLTWGCDKESRSSNYGNGALYFDVSGSTAGKGLAVYKPGEDGATGKNAISAYIPAMRFELSEGGESKIAKFAKSRLAPYATTTDADTRYRVNDGTEEYIEIKEDGSVVLHIGEGKELTPLYYTVNNAAWLAEDPDSSRVPPEVTSVVFSSEDWYAQNTNPKTTDRPTLTLNWDEANRQFAVASDTICCAADGSTLSRLYTTATKYQQQDAIDEGLAYMYQYVKGTYTPSTTALGGR